MEKLKVMIIGCGRVASKHLKAIEKNKDRVELKALVDVSEEAARKLSPGTPFYKDYKQAIEEVKPDIVAVTVPSGLHYEIAVYAMKNGCNLLLEKPMSMSSNESREIYELSKATGKKIAMGHIYRYFPIVGLVHDDIKAGRFGKVTHGSIFVRWGHGDDYYGSAAWRGTWKSDGGALMNQTIHAIDLLVWLMGSSPVEAASMISQRKAHIEADDLGMAILKMDDGSLASIEGTTCTPENDHAAEFTVFCENGVITMGIRRGKPSVNIRDGKGKKLNGSYIMRQIRKSGPGSLLGALNPHTAIYSDLIEAIDNDRQPVADAYAGYTSVDNLMGIYKAAKLGETVKLPLDEDFSSEDMKGYFESKGS
ncbi:MAG: Gfo/Idh/MocA family oxidoreductase [Clostridiales bacterium]|nr:Gfo/Idh/MocA family oxidoreductase [Clostridiales bacterium]